MVALVYGDLFVCDLGTAIASNTVPPDARPYLAACVYTAVAALHASGLVHRYVTPEAVYITDKGVPKLTDMRYCKVRDRDRDR